MHTSTQWAPSLIRLEYLPVTLQPVRPTHILGLCITRLKKLSKEESDIHCHAYFSNSICFSYNNHDRRKQVLANERITMTEGSNCTAKFFNAFTDDACRVYSLILGASTVLERKKERKKERKHVI